MNMTPNQVKLQTIKPGEWYIEYYTGALCCCTMNDNMGDDLWGISYNPLYEDNFFCNSFVFNISECVTQWELPYLVTISKEAPDIYLTSVRQMRDFIECREIDINDAWRYKDILTLQYVIECIERSVEILLFRYAKFNGEWYYYEDKNAKKYINLMFKYYESLNTFCDKLENPKN